jgi:hypothetical protein
MLPGPLVIPQQVFRSRGWHWQTVDLIISPQNGNNSAIRGRRESSRGTVRRYVLHAAFSFCPSLSALLQRIIPLPCATAHDPPFSPPLDQNTPPNPPRTAHARNSTLLQLILTCFHSPPSSPPDGYPYPFYTLLGGFIRDSRLALVRKGRAAPVLL